MLAYSSTKPYKKCPEFKKSVRQTWSLILYARCLYCSCTYPNLAKFYKFVITITTAFALINIEK
jgi:hypothetical protein